MNLEIIESVIDLIEMGAVRSEDVVKNLRSAIKDTLKQSSTPPQRTEQEPLTFIKSNVTGIYTTQPEQKPVAKYSDIVSDGGLDPRNVTPPPQRTWVGLDYQDKKKFSSWLDHKTDDEVFTAIDDLLRNMNT